MSKIKECIRFHGQVAVAAVFVLAVGALSSRANGIYTDGVGARSMSMAGADVAWANDSLGSLAVNPAGMGFQDDTDFDLGVVGGSPQWRIQKGATSATAH